MSKQLYKDIDKLKAERKATKRLIREQRKLTKILKQQHVVSVELAKARSPFDTNIDTAFAEAFN